MGEIAWRKARQPTPVFLPGEFHGQSSLAGYSPCGHKESDVSQHCPAQRITGTLARVEMETGGENCCATLKEL